VADQNTSGLSSADLNALLGKLETFADGLAPGERAAFDSFLEQALSSASQGVEVSGYDYTAILPEGSLLHSFGLA
jgi:hypothetical protein